MTEKQKLLDQDPDDFGLQADLLVAVNNSARLLSNQYVCSNPIFPAVPDFLAQDGEW